MLKREELWGREWKCLVFSFNAHVYVCVYAYAYAYAYVYVYAYTYTSPLPKGRFRACKNKAKSHIINNLLRLNVRKLWENLKPRLCPIA